MIPVSIMGLLFSNRDPMPRNKSNDSVTKKMGKNIRLLRCIRGVSQQELASFLGVSYQQVQKYEDGKNSLSAEKLLYLSQYLHCDPTRFYDGLLAVEPQLKQPLEGNETNRQAKVLLKHFNKISSDSIREATCSLLQALTKENELK